MKPSLFPSLLALSLAACGVTSFAAEDAALRKLAIGTVNVNAATSSAAAASGRKVALDRMTENLGAQLLAAFQTGRRFQLVGRADGAALVEEAAATGKAFAFGEADYLLVVTVDDFQDAMETKTFATLGTTVTSRTLRLAAISSVYEVKTGAVLEVANLSVSRTAPEEQRGQITGDTRDALLRELVQELAEKTARYVSDVVYPARIVARTNEVVTLNRGDGTGIAPGQLWEVFALGTEMKDPDTGASLGREEVLVGKIRVTRVTAKTSQARVEEDLGIDRGALVRPVAQ
ncbi:MAG: hypothetical protein FJ382_02750 [Verrucomicrobia bacterium]|nr:hypothetical protein [Verrucomicrobiota bacterium]